MSSDNHDKDNLTSGEFKKTFDRCPGCGSTERYYEGILNELKAKGMVDAKVGCFDFQQQKGFPLPEQKMATLPFGSEIPHFEQVWDTCCDCGMMYSVGLAKRVVKKTIELAKPDIQLNRAQRRRMEKQIPYGNNPPLN